MLKRVSSRRKVTKPGNSEASPSSSKENLVMVSSEKSERQKSDRPSLNDSIASNDHEKLIKAAVARSKSSSRLFGRSRTSADDSGVSSSKHKDGTPRRGVRRHTSELKKADAKKAQESGTGSGIASGTFEYREMVVNGKKKMVKVKKKSAAEAAAEAANDGHRKLVKVKVKQVMKKHTQQQNELQNSVPIKVGIPANHQLRKPSTTTGTNSKYNNNNSDNISGVWSKAARSIFSFGNDKRSRASSAGDPDEEMDLVFQPDIEERKEGKQEGNNDQDPGGTAKGRLKESKAGYQPPTQLNGLPGVAPKKDLDDPNANNGENNEKKDKAVPVLTPRQPEFFARYVSAGMGGDFAFDGPPMEIHTNNQTKTKTKSIFQSEAMIRRQFIQDQWLSGGSNYQVWEKAAANNRVDMSVVTAITDYMMDSSSKNSDEEVDDVSEISVEDLVPDMLLEAKEQDELEQWEALCTHRINRYGPRSALTAESFVNRGIAQMEASRLDEAADSLLSAVCFLEEVHGSIDHTDRMGNGGAPSHMHMAQAFYFLGKVYMLQEQYPMAESAFYKALNIRQQHLGKVHPDSVECWEQIGLSYIQRAAQASGEKQSILERQAMDIMSQVLKLKRAIFGSIHVSVARTARSVAKLCAMRNESERAQRLYKQVLNVLAQMDKDLTAMINPEFPDPRDLVKHKERKQELLSIEEEMKKFNLKEERLEI